MKLSTRTRYGMRAMIEIARHYGKGPIKRRDITNSQGISHSYLENILIALKTKGLLSTVRGAEGGFVLDHPPGSVNLYEIVTALEGSIAPVDCLESPEDCDRVQRCPARQVWQMVHDAQKKVLENITLEQLLEMEREPGSDFSI